MNTEESRRRVVDLLAGAAYGRDATCGPVERPKVDYRSRDGADRAAAALTRKSKDGKTLEGYPCFWCLGWHIGRAMTVDERARFLPLTEGLFHPA